MDYQISDKILVKMEVIQRSDDGYSLMICMPDKKGPPFWILKEDVFNIESEKQKTGEIK